MDDFNENSNNIFNLNSRISLLTSKCVQYQYELNEKENKFLNLLNEYEFKKKEFESEKKNFEKREEENKKDKEKLNKQINLLTDKYNKKIDELRKENSQIKKESFEKEQIITIKNEEIINLKNKYESIEITIENYRKQILKMKNEYYFLKQILNDKENEIKGLYELKSKFDYKELIEDNKIFDYNNYDNLKEQFTLLNKKYKRLKEEKSTIFNNSMILLFSSN